MPLAPDDVRKVARLARLAIADDEVAPTLDTLNRTLDLIGQMQAVDTTGVEPMSHAHDVSLRLRPDAVTEPDCRDALMANAPAAERGLFLVPRVIE
ncbi:MAG: Asp-tRNA(Asn)/Glu-tRNA(Gln) amidotransferase subunit GatC [Rhodocyclaceae bacterium]|nr:Asp-tRNA(Asn)/Glu-tRNA(Gln) amidotransferase subunit GatC [Rhodocyclaceae bacterium]